VDAPDAAEERQVVPRHVDRASPGAVDLRAGERRQQLPQPTLSACSSRRVGAEARIEPAAVADRPGTAPHQDTAVRSRTEIVQEHSPVDDRLAARPADLVEQLGHGFSQDDVAAEVRQRTGERPPARRGGVDGEYDLTRAHPAARERELPVSDA